MAKLKSGAVQKQGSGAPTVGGGTPAVYHGNSRLELDPRLQIRIKSQGRKPKD